MGSVMMPTFMGSSVLPGCRETVSGLVYIGQSSLPSTYFCDKWTTVLFSTLFVPISKGSSRFAVQTQPALRRFCV